MFGHDLFAPLSQNGVIFQLQHSSTASYAAFRWDETSHSWIHSHIPMDRFMMLPSATRADLAAAGFAPCDPRLQQKERRAEPGEKTSPHRLTMGQFIGLVPSSPASVR